MEENTIAGGEEEEEEAVDGEECEPGNSDDEEIFGDVLEIGDESKDDD